MPIKQIVIYSSPLITLYKSELVDLLPQLFGTVQVPPSESLVELLKQRAKEG